MYYHVIVIGQSMCTSFRNIRHFNAQTTIVMSGQSHCSVFIKWICVRAAVLGA